MRSLARTLMTKYLIKLKRLQQISTIDMQNQL